MTSHRRRPASARRPCARWPRRLRRAPPCRCGSPESPQIAAAARRATRPPRPRPRGACHRGRCRRRTAPERAPGGRRRRGSAIVPPQPSTSSRPCGAMTRTGGALTATASGAVELVHGVGDVGDLVLGRAADGAAAPARDRPDARRWGSRRACSQAALPPDADAAACRSRRATGCRASAGTPAARRAAPTA